MQMLYRVELSYAVFGIVCEGNKITEAAPIGRWMVGKPFLFVCEWIGRKGGTIKKESPNDVRH